MFPRDTVYSMFHSNSGFIITVVVNGCSVHSARWFPASTRVLVGQLTHRRGVLEQPNHLSVMIFFEVFVSFQNHAVFLVEDVETLPGAFACALAVT